MFRLVAVVLLASAATPEAAPCVGPIVASTSLVKPGSVSARRPGGYLVVIEPTPVGPEVSVYQEGPSGRSENLLAVGSSDGEPSPSLVAALLLPDFGTQRLIPVRNTSHFVCITLRGARVSGAGAKAHFNSGTLEVRWVSKQLNGREPR